MADKSDLRRRAEEIARDRATHSSNDHEALSHEATQQMLYELQVHQIELEMQNEELRRNEERLRSILYTAMDGFLMVDGQGRIQEVNESYCKMSGYSEQELLTMGLQDLNADSSAEFFASKFQMVIMKGQEKFETQHRRKDGSIFDIEVSAQHRPSDNGCCIAFVRDITERKGLAAYFELSRNILETQNMPGSLQETIQRVLSVIKKRTGFDAVGIRLQQGDDFPYITQDGFSLDFLLTENTIVERSADGIACRDNEGKVKPECTCGLVLSGKIDPTNPYFTAGGSFWTNNSFPLLEIPPDEDLRYHPRNRCIHLGYTSIALVPIRHKGRIMGMIQLNDRGKGRFSLKQVEVLEEIASHVGEALMQKQIETELRESEVRYRSLFERASVGILIMSLKGQQFAVNEVYAHMHGYSITEMQSMSLNDIHTPENLRLVPERIRRLLAGEVLTYEAEHYHKDGHAFPIEVAASTITYNNEIHIQSFVRDITERKQAEGKLQKVNEHLLLATEAGGVGIWEYDPIHNHLTWEDQMYRLYGITAGDFGGAYEAWQASLHPEDLERGDLAIQMALRGEKEFDIEFRVVWPDDSIHYISARALVHRDASGQPVKMIGTNYDLTEYKQAELALRASEERHRTILQAAMDGFWLTDMQGRFLEVNESYCRMSGYSKQELLTLHIPDIEALETESDTAAHIQLVMANKLDRFESRHRRKDGSLFDVDISAQYRNAEGGRLAIFIRDITERKQAEEARSKSDEQVRLLLNSTAEAIYGLDLQGICTFANPSCARLLGYSDPEELVGKHIHQLIHHSYPDGSPMPEEACRIFRATREGVGLHNDDEVMWKADGTRFPVEYWSYPQKLGNELLGSVNTFVDITERKRAEEVLREAGLYARNLIESSLDPLVTISVDGKITDVNFATEKITGVSREKLVGTDFSEYFTEPELARVGYLRAFGEGQVIDYPLVIRHASGFLSDVLYNASVFRDEHGKVQGLFAAARDITLRKQAEEALHETEEREYLIKLREQQRRLNLERKSALAMAVKTDELERSYKELQQFAYVASHDLQEPLRMVASFTQLLAERYAGKLDDKADKYIGYAVDGAKRMQLLLNDLLAYSRVSTRSKPFAKTDCADLLREVTHSLGRIIQESGAEVVVSDLPTVMADRVQLGQVFQNLIDNAIKFRGDAPPRVEITAQRNGELWEFCVADSGIGVDPQFHERIFLIFQRLHERGKYPGNGMGLAICKKVVERHGGRIWIESELGKGTRIRFTILVTPREDEE
ncbi:MAG: PAS domain S-box protein [Anaerolineae bacterium]